MSKDCRLKDCRLYVIIDKEVVKKRDILKTAEDILRGGADILQLRDKISSDRKLLGCAKKLRKIIKGFKRIFIINDRIDIAKIVDSDGIHLGQDDIPIHEARKILREKIIGLSVHNVEQAKKAEKEGADYVGFGPVFESKTKKGRAPKGLPLLQKAGKELSIPCFAIGGISDKNLKNLRKAGMVRAAVLSAAVKNRNVYQTVKNLKEALDNAVYGDISNIKN